MTELCPWCQTATLVDLDPAGRQVVKCRNPQCIRYEKILEVLETTPITTDKPTV